MKDSFGYNKEIKREKPYLQYKLIYKHCLKKTWDDRFAGKLGEWGILRKGGILVMGDYFEMGDWNPFTDYVLLL